MLPILESIDAREVPVDIRVTSYHKSARVPNKVTDANYTENSQKRT